MSARAEPRDPSDERAWLARAVVVLQSPRAVFAALGDDRDEPARARQEAVLALVILAGIAGILWTPVAGRVMDDPAYDGILVAVWAFIGGGFYGIALYWVAGGLLWLGVRAANGRGSYRQARHIVAFAAAPVVLSLFLVWPIRIALYHADLFRTGGSDAGTGNAIFGLAALAFTAWSTALLVVGVRAVHRWSWGRAALAAAVAALLPALVALASVL